MTDYNSSDDYVPGSSIGLNAALTPNVGRGTKRLTPDSNASESSKRSRRRRRGSPSRVVPKPSTARRIAVPSDDDDVVFLGCSSSDVVGDNSGAPPPRRSDDRFVPTPSSFSPTSSPPRDASFDRDDDDVPGYDVPAPSRSDVRPLLPPPPPVVSVKGTAADDSPAPIAKTITTTDDSPAPIAPPPTTDDSPAPTSSRRTVALLGAPAVAVVAACAFAYVAEDSRFDVDDTFRALAREVATVLDSNGPLVKTLRKIYASSSELVLAFVSTTYRSLASVDVSWVGPSLRSLSDLLVRWGDVAFRSISNVDLSWFGDFLRSAATSSADGASAAAAKFVTTASKMCPSPLVWMRAPGRFASDVGLWGSCDAFPGSS